MCNRSHILLILFLFFFSPQSRAQAEPSNDRMQFVRDIVVDPGDEVEDALCIFCSIHLRGDLVGDAVAVGGGIEIDGNVEGDVVAVGGDTRLGPAAKVKGDFVAVGGRFVGDPKASVDGETVSAPWFHFPGQRQVSFRGLLAMVGLSCGLALITALAARKRRLEVIANTLHERLGAVILIGIGVQVAATVLFVVSVYLGRAGAVVVLPLSVALLVSAIVGYTGISFFLGHRLALKSGTLASAMLGAILVAVIQLIPILGFLAFLAFSWLALGCAVLSGYGSAGDWLFRPFATQAVAPPSSV